MNITNDITQSGKPLVAVVDDDESVREAMESLLRSIGCRAEAFDSAEEFLLSGRLPETNCLILDVKMPVFITAHWDEATRAHALQLGAVDFLRKPCSDEALLDAVRLALAVNHIPEGA